MRRRESAVLFFRIVLLTPVPTERVEGRRALVGVRETLPRLNRRSPDVLW